VCLLCDSTPQHMLLQWILVLVLVLVGLFVAVGGRKPVPTRKAKKEEPDATHEQPSKPSLSCDGPGFLCQSLPVL
jgi:hypothetical protein